MLDGVLKKNCLYLFMNEQGRKKRVKKKLLSESKLFKIMKV